MDIRHFSRRPGLLADLAAMPRLWGSSIELAAASLSINLLALALPLVLMQVYDRIVPNASLSTLTWLVLGFFGALVAESGLRLSRSTITNWIAAQFEHRLGTSAMRHVLDSRIDDFERDGVGVYLDRFQAVSSLRGLYAGQLLQLIMDLPFAFLYLGLLYLLGGTKTTLYAVAVIVVYLLVATLVRRAYHAGRKQQKELGNRRYNFIIECLTGIHTLKALGIEEPMLRRHERLQADTARNNMSLNFHMHLPGILGNFFSRLMLFGIILTAGFGVINGQITMGALVACSLIGMRLLGPFQKAAAFWVQLANVRIAKSQLADLAALRMESSSDTQSLPDDIEGGIELDNITFSYQPEQQPVLDSLSLKVEPCQMIGIMTSGERGASTLLSIMAGLLPPDSGRVKVDDFDLAQCRHGDLSGRIALVQQSGVMFKGTIFDNICLFNPRYREKARDAAQLLALDKDVARLPKGYETQIGDKLHEGLPPGMVQRIALARALVVRPRILLLDNVGTSMDQNSESVLLWLLGKLKGGTTMVVVVSDDPYVLSLCDRVMHLHAGGLVEDCPILTPSKTAIQEDEAMSQAWMRWVMQTARRWTDISGIVRPIDIAKVDDDHKVFTELVLELNVLIESLSRGEPGMVILEKEKQLFDKVLDYAKVHFDHEETIMLEENLPGYPHHKAQHVIFSGLINDIRKDFQSGRVHATDRLKLTILDWWVSHINNIDYPTFILKSSFEETKGPMGTA